MSAKKKSAPSAKAPAKAAAKKPAAKKPAAPAARRGSSPRALAAPAGRSTAVATKATAETARAGHTVLLVDDFPDAREMYIEYLAFAGFGTAEASNGAEALERALELHPSVILMDLAMPVMDGWEATRRLKADPRTRKIPVIAVTGHALEGDAERARQAGCDGVISKPCLPQDLLAEVRRAIAQGAKK